MTGESRSSATTPPAWARWAVPSLADFLFLGLLYFLLFTPFCISMLDDAGIGWHIRTGQQFLATHVIPRVDSFSAIMAGKPWFAWEWLYDALAGELDSSMGLNGVTWLTAVVIASVFGWLFRLLILRGTHLLFALALTSLAFLASTIHALTRPHVLSWLLALAFYALLDASEREASSPQASRRLWLLPLLTLLWANVHASFPLGFALIGAYWLPAFWSWRRHQDPVAAKRARELTAIGIACIVASLVNPYGWHLHGHILGFLGNGVMMSQSEEYQSPDFHQFAPRCFLLLLLICVATFIARARELRVSQTLLALLSIYAALYAARSLPTSSLFLAMAAGPLLKPATRGFAADMAAMDREQRGHLWPIAAVLLTAWVAANGGWVGNRKLLDAHFDPHHMPVEAVNYIERNPVPGPILSTDGWGGYFIYRLFPRSLVVLDDRQDLFGEELMSAYRRMVDVQPGWDKFLLQHSTGYVVLPADAPLSSMLRKTEGWRVVHSDDVAVVFLHTPSCAGARLSAEPCRSRIPPAASPRRHA
jgi:hypothetical protein